MGKFIAPGLFFCAKRPQGRPAATFGRRPCLFPCHVLFCALVAPWAAKLRGLSVCQETPYQIFINSAANIALFLDFFPAPVLHFLRLDRRIGITLASDPSAGQGVRRMTAAGLDLKSSIGGRFCV